MNTYIHLTAAVLFYQRCNYKTGFVPFSHKGMKPLQRPSYKQISASGQVAFQSTVYNVYKTSLCSVTLTWC